MKRPDKFVGCYDDIWDNFELYVGHSVPTCSMCVGEKKYTLPDLYLLHPEAIKVAQEVLSNAISGETETVFDIAGADKEIVNICQETVMGLDFQVEKINDEDYLMSSRICLGCDLNDKTLTFHHKNLSGAKPDSNGEYTLQSIADCLDEAMLQGICLQ